MAGLTDAQYVALATDITNTHAAEFAAAVAANDDQAIAATYNALASPDFWVWRTSVSKQEAVGATSQDGTTFTWAGNGFITRSVQELLCWQELFDNAGHAVNPSLANIRQAFADIFSGVGNAAANRTHLTTVARRKALRIERLFAAGTGSTGSPGTLTFEGTVSYLDIAHALRGVPL